MTSKVTMALFAGTVIAIGASAASDARSANLQPHRAVYDLVLMDASERSGVESANGRMVYEYSGGPCEGYTTNFRSVTRYVTDVAAQLIDQRLVAHESPDEDRYSFTSESFIDNMREKSVAGVATPAGKGLSVELVQPVKNDFELGSAQFPTAHMRDVLRRAEAGERVFETRLYDGTDNADQVFLTNVVIGEETMPEGEGTEADLPNALQGEAYWPVSMSYYEAASEEDEAENGEDTPIFRSSFKLYRNGIARDFTLYYDDFTLRQTLVELTLIEPKSCKQSG